MENNKTMKKYFPVFVLPTLLAFTVFFIVPFVMGFGLSFTKFKVITNVTFVGFKNYIKAFTLDDSFFHALGFTSLFTIVSMISFVSVSFAVTSSVINRPILSM